MITYHPISTADIQLEVYAIRASWKKDFTPSLVAHRILKISSLGAVAGKYLEPSFVHQRIFVGFTKHFC